MAPVKKDEKLLNVIDVFWDGWFNSFKTFQSLQNGMSQKSLEFFESQKELIKSTLEQLSQLESETKKLTTDWKDNLQEVLKESQLDFGANNLTEWTDKFEEVGHKAESLAFSPSKTTVEMISKSHAQLESALKKAIDQQQKNRAEVLDTIEDYVDQLKQTQNGVLQSIEVYNPLVAK